MLFVGLFCTLMVLVLLKPWDMVADGGKSGKGRFVVDLEVMMFPFGTMTLTDGLSMEVGWCCK